MIQMKNKYDAFMKAKRVIESCKTDAQLINARNYYYLFENMYQDTFLNYELDTIFFDKLDLLEISEYE